MASGEGAAPGAVYVPLASMVPQGAPAEHAAPCTCQTTFWLLVPRTVATKDWTARGASVKEDGMTVTTRRLITVISAVALRVVSATLVARTVTGSGVGVEPGASKSTWRLLPLISGWHGLLATTQICPTVPFPLRMPLTVQVTALFALPKTWALNVTRRRMASVSVPGERLTPTPA